MINDMGEKAENMRRTYRKELNQIQDQKRWCMKGRKNERKGMNYSLQKAQQIRESIVLGGTESKSRSLVGNFKGDEEGK